MFWFIIRLINFIYLFNNISQCKDTKNFLTSRIFLPYSQKVVSLQSTKLSIWTKISTGNMMYTRDYYLNELKIRRHNNMIKIVTGMRRCGKSFLLFKLFADHLLAEGVKEDHIIKINLEDRRRKALRDPDELLKYIDAHIIDKDMHYILLDEVQYVNEFEDVLNSYLDVPNADIYVTGSNARFLSKDIITEFRGRGDDVRLHPFSFNEFIATQPATENRDKLIQEYMIYGGLPQVILAETESEKKSYLRSLFANTYLKDIKERYDIKLDDDLEELVSILASNIGGLTNPHKLASTFHSVKKSTISQDTIKKYLDYLQDAFLVERAVRYDIKGRHYIDTPSKYYFEDLGIRNARLNFRQMEETHLMENLIYNELRNRGFSVDVGEMNIKVPATDGKTERRQLEVDFVCNQGFRRYYIQSAYSLADNAKREQELRPLRSIGDSFRKMVITSGLQPRYQNDEGIMFVSLYDFLVNPNSLSD